MIIAGNINVKNYGSNPDFGPKIYSQNGKS